MTTEEKLEKIKKLADDMYYAAANLGPNVGSGERLRKTMEDYHKFIVREFNEEEPVNEDLDNAALDYANKELVKAGVTDTNCPREMAVAQASLMVNGYKAGAAWQRQQYIKIFKEFSELANHQDGCYALECIQMRLDSLIDEE